MQLPGDPEAAETQKEKVRPQPLPRSSRALARPAACVGWSRRRPGLTCRAHTAPHPGEEATAPPRVARTAGQNCKAVFIISLFFFLKGLLTFVLKAG